MGGEVVTLPAEDGQTSDLFMGGPDVFSLCLAWLRPHRGGQQTSSGCPDDDLRVGSVGAEGRMRDKYK